MSSLLKLAGVTLAAVPVVLATTAPADAGTRWSYRSSGLSAEAQFTILGEMAGAPGNAHVGSVYATTDGGAGGFVSDWTCPAGELPPTYGEPEPVPGDAKSSGGSVDDEPPYEEPETNCVFEQARDFWGEDVDVAIGKKLGAGTVSGTVTVWTWDGQTEEEPVGVSGEIDLAFTGTGTASTTTEYSRDKNYSYKYSETIRQASVAGDVLGMTLDSDNAAGTLRKYAMYERGRS